ncbi:MAG: GNAT family N-acetyltransferase [Candidatus Bathyarchaeia archaeon]
MRFEVGCDLDEFRRYYRNSDIYERMKLGGLTDGYDENLDYMMNVVIKHPSQLIVWREKNKIVGHAVWHESNTEEHRKGDPRNKEDREALRKLLGNKKDFVELHEWWLIEKYRGKGYGNEFLDFFETFMKSKGYADLVFYADHPAALAAFREHGYKEGGYLKGAKEYVFYHSLEQSP